MGDVVSMSTGRTPAGSMIWLDHGDQRRYDTTFRFTRT